MEEQQKANKPKVISIVIYFVVLGLFYGWQLFFRPNAIGGFLPLLIVIGLFASAYGVSQYESWGRKLGLFFSWIILLILGWIFFDFLGSLALNTLAGAITIFVTLVFIGADIVVIRVLSSLKNVFYD